MIDLYPESCVYILQVAGTQNFKIGMTRDPDKRIHDWRNTISFVNLEIVAVYYTPAARTLESELHEYFGDYRIGGSEWFELREDDTEFFRKPGDELLEFFGVDDAADDNVEPDEGPYSNIMELPKPRENIAVKTEEVSKKLSDKQSERLHRIPDGEDWPAGIEPPSADDEFHNGLLPEAIELYEELGTWQAVGNYYDLSKEEIWYIVEHKHMPTDNPTRKKLGLSTFLETKDFISGALPPEGIK